ncbi:MAG: hypothetical protein IJR17_07250 [Clostridia bacterium]|nr:hypothetical protein [Clostridia bacterium]
MNKHIIVTAILAPVFVAVFLLTSFKAQEKSDSIAETYHNPMRPGKILSIQTGTDGMLYIWNSNHSLIKMDSASGEKTYFYQDIERGDETVFCVIGDELHFITYTTREVYTAAGRLLRREENKESVQNSKVAHSGHALYTVKDYILFQEVWQITQQEKNCIYRRLSITSFQIFLVCFAVFFYSTVCVLKQAGIGMKFAWRR